MKFETNDYLIYLYLNLGSLKEINLEEKNITFSFKMVLVKSPICGHEGQKIKALLIALFY